jgi:nucleoid-associated protein YgaU
MAYSGSLEKMEIIPYEDEKFRQESTKKGGRISVQINPAKYSRSYCIKYNAAQGQGSSNSKQTYNRTPPDKVTFQLVFDGTGLIPSSRPGKASFKSDGISEEIDALLDVTISYDSKIHQPRFVKLIWGTLVFKCRLSALNLTYTLFKPDGSPLRATADITFIGFSDELTSAKQANKNSPDLTHIVTVKQGDTLPSLCFNIYGSSLYYLEIAKRNSIVDFQSLAPGTVLSFPPLGAETT